MSKAVDVAKASARGSFQFLWGLVVSTIISAVGTIFIGRLLGSDLYGLYSIVLTAPDLLFVFRDLGVNSAMVKFTAQFRSEGRLTEVRSVFLSGLIFEVALGLVLSAILFALSDVIAVILNRPDIGPLIQLASFTVLASGLVNAATAAFTGMERMELNSVMLILQSVIKTMVVVALVILGLGPAGAVIGFTVSFFTAGLIGVLFIWILYRKLPKLPCKMELIAYLKEMLKYGLPLSISSILIGFLAQFFAFLLPIHYVTDNNIIGNYRIAQTFVVLIGFFATPITTMLFPAFSKLNPEKDKETLRNVFQSSIKYAALLVVPVSALVMSVSEPAISTLFGDTYTTAPLFLALLAIAYLYSAIGNLSTGNLINGQGHTTYNMKLAIITSSIGFPMGYIMIMNFGVLGLIATSLTAGLPSLFISLRWLKTNYDVTVDWRSSAKILLSSTIAGTLTYLIITQLPLASWIRLLIGVAIFLLIFILAALFTRTITRSEINNLRNMTTGFGILTGILDKLLNLLNKLITILRLQK
jgi:stage V sporulation protein B